MEIKTICNKKATIVYSKNETSLYSYDTLILKLNDKKEVIYVTDDESHLTLTTIKHVKAFCQDVNIKILTKKDLLKFNK